MATVLQKRKNTIIIILAVIVVGVLAIGLLSNSAFGSLFGLVRDQARSGEIERLATTDLSGISVDGIQIGTDVDNVDLSIYQQSNRFSVGDHAYYLDRLVLNVDDDNKVSHIFGYNSEVSISINNHTAATIDDITGLLGDNYLDGTEDSEQKLKKHIYYDSNADVVADFIYSDYDQQFVWITLRKMQ